MVNRKAMYIYYKKDKVYKDLAKKLDFIYYSKKEKYAKLYFNEKDEPAVMKILSTHKGIKTVDSLDDLVTLDIKS